MLAQSAQRHTHTHTHTFFQNWEERHSIELVVHVVKHVHCLGNTHIHTTLELNQSISVDAMGIFRVWIETSASRVYNVIDEVKAQLLEALATRGISSPMDPKHDHLWWDIYPEEESTFTLLAHFWGVLGQIHTDTQTQRHRHTHRHTYMQPKTKCCGKKRSDGRFSQIMSTVYTQKKLDHGHILCMFLLYIRTHIRIHTYIHTMMHIRVA